METIKLYISGGGVSMGYNKYAMTVSDLFSEHFRKYNLKLFSGEKGLYNRINKVTVMEAADSFLYYTGGEFVISMLYSVKDDQEAQKKLIAGLADKKIAALTIKMNRYLDSVPDFFQIESENYNMPIILMPKEVNYRDLIYDIYYYMLFNSKTYYHIKELFFGKGNADILKEFKIELQNTVIWLTEGKDIFFRYQVNNDQILIKLNDYLAGLLAVKKAAVSRKEIIKQINEGLPASVRSNVIISGLIGDLTEIGRTYKNLKAGFNLIKNYDAKTRFYFIDDYLTEIMLLNSMDGKFYTELINRYIKPLQEYDLEYNNELIKTLTSYYQYGNIKEASKNLNIHENTIRYRLKLVSSVLNINLKNIRDSLKLFVALNYYTLVPGKTKS